MDEVDIPRVGGFSLNWMFSELRILSGWSAAQTTEDETEGHLGGEESDLGLVGVRGSKSCFS